MGTLSKRRVEDFGVDVKAHIDDFRNRLGSKLDELGDKVEAAQAGAVEHNATLTQVERVLAAVPSTTWLALAGVSLLGSFGAALIGKHRVSTVLGPWGPTFLIVGLYNKLTKVGAATALLSSRP